MLSDTNLENLDASLRIKYEKQTFFLPCNLQKDTIASLKSRLVGILAQFPTATTGDDGSKGKQRVFKVDDIRLLMPKQAFVNTQGAMADSNIVKTAIPLISENELSAAGGASGAEEKKVEKTCHDLGLVNDQVVFLSIRQRPDAEWTTVSIPSFLGLDDAIN